METKVFEMHEVVKEIAGVTARVAEIVDRSDRNDLVTFTKDPVSFGRGATKVEVHVFSGIQHLAKFFNKEIAITHRKDYEIYDLEISFVKDNVRYFQIETSEERKKKLEME